MSRPKVASALYTVITSRDHFKNHLCVFVKDTRLSGNTHWSFHVDLQHQGAPESR